MTATILQFPTNKLNEERLTRVGDLVKSAVPVPTTTDLELDMLLQIGGKLLDNLDDYVMPDCSGLIDRTDDFVVRLDRWEAKNAR